MKKLVFLCGARDFHAIDWYRSSLEQLPKENVSILTDLISGEGFKKIVTEKDTIHSLLILDKFLFKGQSYLGNLWRNILKLLVLPTQIILLKRFAKKNPNSTYHAHSMYYLWLAAGAGVEFIGTPQGSDLLVKPFRSKIYKTLSIWAMRAAKNITVDSVKMRDKAFEIANITPEIIQNGIDVKSIEVFLNSQSNNQIVRNKLLSIRGMTPLYRIEEILSARDYSNKSKDFPISLIYPFYEKEYKKKGWITSYKAISFNRNSPDDWNLMLLTEYPNWATFDRKEEEWEAIVDKVFKNKQAQDSSDEDRKNIRVLWGSKIGREMIPVI